VKILKEEKRYYRIIAQTETMTITGQTKAVTEEQAIKDAPLVIGGGSFPTRSFVLQPIATEDAWNSGYINFCPRCGSKQDIEDSWSRFECDNCSAEVDCNITVYDDEIESDDDQEESDD
jgi:NADH pyrophosphatase NudC (nudix superfamily)